MPDTREVQFTRVDSERKFCRFTHWNGSNNPDPATLSLAMQSTKLFLGGTLILLAFAAGAQNASSSLAPAERKESTATAPKTAKKKTGFFAPKKAKATGRRKQNVKHTARYEFYERIEKAAKDKQRMLKILAKPQYSDPSYFGHKKKPKRRPPHKMRMCDECQIRH
jgi:hypothetical protein